MIGGMRSYPKEVVIGDQIWEIRFTKTLQARFKAGANSKDEYLGWCDEANSTIWIKYGMSRRETFVTFIHEVIHAFESEGEFSIPHHFVFKLEGLMADFLIENCSEIANIVCSGNQQDLKSA